MTGKAIWYNKSTSFAKKVSGGGTLLMPPEGKIGIIKAKIIIITIPNHQEGNP